MRDSMKKAHEMTQDIECKDIGNPDIIVRQNPFLFAF